MSRPSLPDRAATTPLPSMIDVKEMPSRRVRAFRIGGAGSRGALPNPSPFFFRGASDAETVLGTYNSCSHLLRRLLPVQPVATAGDQRTM